MQFQSMNILLHMFQVYLPLYQNCIDSVVLISLNGLFILPVKFTQNRQNKQRHFYSTSKTACRLSKSIVARTFTWRALEIKILFLDCVRSGKESVQRKLCSDSMTHTTKIL